MPESIYAPPEADVAVASNDETDFYVVAPRKFMLLSVLTFNLYLVYWFYNNWRRIKLSTGEKMWPPMRGLFYIFFTHSLLDNVEKRIELLGKKFAWRPNAIATVVVVLTLLAGLLDRLAAREIGSPVTDLLGAVLVPVTPAILLKAQHAVNFACDDPAGSSNSSLTAANWVWMVLGSLLWLLVLIGVYFMLFEPELLVE